MNLTERFRTAGAVITLTLTTLTAGRADVVFEWNDALIQYSAAAPEGLTPLLEARAYAMAHLAMHQAIEATASRSRPMGAADDAAVAAVAAAANSVLIHVLPGRAASHDVLQAAQLARIPEGNEKARGVMLGRRVAARLIDQRESDRWMRLAGSESAARATPSRSPAGALHESFPQSPWAAATPFVLKEAGQVAVDPLHSLDFDKNVIEHSWLVRAKVFDGVDRSALDVLREFWSERPIAAWNRVARACMLAAGGDRAVCARVLATLNLAIADATLGAAHWRFVLGSWRWAHREGFIPEDGVDAHPGSIAEGSDGVGATSDTRRVVGKVFLPPVADFPSFTASMAGAAEAALVRLCHADRLAFSVPPPAIGPRAGRVSPRTFRNVQVAARECAFTASLDGRHSREACVAGYQFGVKVGDAVAKRMAR